MSGKARGARVLGRALRMPSVLDRKGTRWMLQALSPAPVIVLIHRGRNSGRVFKTPVEIMVDDPERDEFVVAPMWGRDSDWYRNVVAGGLVEVHVRSEALQVEWRELDEAERRAAMDAYREAQPIYSPDHPSDAGPRERARGRPRAGGAAGAADAAAAPCRILTFSRSGTASEPSARPLAIAQHSSERWSWHGPNPSAAFYGAESRRSAAPPPPRPRAVPSRVCRSSSC